MIPYVNNTSIKFQTVLFKNVASVVSITGPPTHRLYMQHMKFGNDRPFCFRGNVLKY